MSELSLPGDISKVHIVSMSNATVNYRANYTQFQLKHKIEYDTCLVFSNIFFIHLRFLIKYMYLYNNKHDMTPMFTNKMCIHSGKYKSKFLYALNNERFSHLSQIFFQASTKNFVFWR